MYNYNTNTIIAYFFIKIIDIQRFPVNISD